MEKYIAAALFGVIVILAAAIFGFYRVMHVSPTSSDDAVRVIATIADTPDTADMRKDVPTDTRHPLPTLPPQPITLTFVGDMNLDRYARTVAEKNGYAFLLGDDVRSVLQASTCAIGNVEGPITTQKSVSQYSAMGAPDNYRFTFDPAVIPFLAEAGFCAVSIGNNHIGNFGTEGIASTRTLLGESDVAFFGDVGDDAERVFVREFNGVRVAIVGSNTFITDGHARALADVHAVRDRADVVIVYPHWGTEYVGTAGTQQQQQAHAFIDAGADAVIGAHPHVIQNTEVYKGKTIYYSVGNFIFDQYFRPETQVGLMVTVTIDPQSATLTFHDTRVEMRTTGQTVLTHSSL